MQFSYSSRSLFCIVRWIRYCRSESINNVKSKMVNKIIIGLCGHKSEVLLTHKKNNEKNDTERSVSYYTFVYCGTYPTKRPITITVAVTCKM